ncbi:hypothetical protein [Rhodopila sp.]|uniref:hypothetical protein n=1 Tax=Rhodopila sp. TaxID=2480087 RepID=UPI003D140ABB
MLQGLTVIGDLLRPDGRGSPGGVDRPTIWLFNAVKRQVALACGLPVSVLSTRHLPELAAALMAERPFEHAALHWAASYHRLADHASFNRHVLPRLRQQFCIGYELPPGLIAVLDAEAIPYIDLRIHPVRFLDDLLFAVRASEPETQAALLDVAVAEAEVIATAGLREAMCQMITDSPLPDDTLLVLGQRPMDATQIVAGRFFDAMDHVDRITAICHSHRAILLKPHPQEQEHGLLVVAAGVARNLIGVTSDNLYRLLSLPMVTAVLTVNSSAAHEAAYFGKRDYTLAPRPVRLAWRGDTLATDQHAAIDDRVLTPDFWRLVLAPHTSVSRSDGVRLTPKPNRLRIALDSFWNYQEIDTDRVPPRPR